MSCEGGRSVWPDPSAATVVVVLLRRAGGMAAADASARDFRADASGGRSLAWLGLCPGRSGPS